MFIRKALESDVPRMMEIYALARIFMAEHGNPEQWGADNWPPEYLIRDDIKAGKSYVCVGGEKPEDLGAGRVNGGFYFDFGKDPEPDYRRITNGAWQSAEPYGVVHRIASDHSIKGIGTYCIKWAIANSGGHLRIDTHPDNGVMRALLTKLGFSERGNVLIGGRKPRTAYEITAQEETADNYGAKPVAGNKKCSPEDSR